MQRYSYISGAAKKSMIFFIAHAYNLQKQVPTFNFSHKNLLISIKLRTFANDHRRIPQWRVGVKSWVNITALADYSVHLET